MIRPTCDACQHELAEFGAILLSPLVWIRQRRKYHLCVGCYEKLTSRLRLCATCWAEEDSGALLISPPDEDGVVKIRHVCKDCCHRHIEPVGIAVVAQ